MILLFLLLFSSVSEARVDVRFLSLVGLVSISDRVAGRVTDDDPQRLYAAMNVEEKDENLGRGKTIKFADKKFSLVCVDRGAGVGICNMVVKAGDQGLVSPGKGIIRFVAMGDEAAELHKLFFVDASGEFEYLTADKTVRIFSDSQSFIAEYHRPH